jgi:hypothetical protein
MKSDDEMRSAFKQLHDPSRPIYQIGQARRSNSAEDYNSKSIRDAGGRLLKASMQTAHGVIKGFAKNSRKPA